MQPIYPDFSDLPDAEEYAHQSPKNRRRFGFPTQIIDGITDVLPEMADWEIPSDVTGSYTGTPADGTEPTQDADDL